MERSDASLYDFPIRYLISRYTDDDAPFKEGVIEETQTKEMLTLLLRKILVAEEQGDLFFDASLEDKDATPRERTLLATLLEPFDDFISRNPRLITREYDPRTPIIVEDGRRFYTQQNYAKEMRFVQLLRQRLEGSRFQEKPLKSEIEVFHPIPLDFSSEQGQALSKSLCERTLFITGGPGTGKTKTIVSIAATLSLCLELDVYLCTPTAKAKDRLVSAIAEHKELSKRLEKRVNTLHQLLGFSRWNRPLRHHRQNPLPADVLIVDESSMIDIQLVNQLLEATPMTTRIIFVGDSNQLAPVEVGSFFEESIRILRQTPKYHSLFVELQKQYRQTPVLNELSRRLLAGKWTAFWAAIQENALLLPSSELPRMVKHCIAKQKLGRFSQLILKEDDLGLAEAPALLNEAFEALNTFVFLSPMRGGKNGLHQINGEFKRLLGEGTHFAYPGMPIIFTENNYVLGIYNGDRAVCVLLRNKLYAAVPTKNSEKGRSYHYHPLSSLGHWEVGYGLSVHRSQGSEYDEVFICLGEDTPLLERKLLYTAITRAKKELHILGEEPSLRSAFEKIRPRLSCIVEKYLRDASSSPPVSQ